MYIPLAVVLLTSWSRYGSRLLSFHEYNTTQFFVVFVAIVLGAQSTGMFLAHASGLYSVPI